MQKLKLELIRRDIASDLHDDIGATLSSINIYTELAQEQYGPSTYMNKIQHHITDAVARLDDLVWSINPKNDTMEQLLNRMRHNALPLLEAAGIQCQFQCDKKFLSLKLGLVDKRNVYLLFKEMINNVVKHARCQNCFITIGYQHPFLTLKVSDDGVGFDPALVNKNRNGLQNMRFRSERMNGTLQINSANNKGSTVVVKLKA